MNQKGISTMERSTASMTTSARVRARLALSGALTAVPQNLVHSVRTRYVSTTGWRRKALRGVPAVLRHRTLAPMTEFTLPGDATVRMSAVDSRLVRLLYWYGDGGYEPGEARWWRHLCSQAGSIVELGANIGYFTVHGAHAAPHASYRAVEANPDTAQILRSNVALNRLTNVDVIGAAVVGDRDVKQVDLALPDEEQYRAPTGAYIKTGGEGIVNRPASRSITVPAVSAASVLSDADLIKLDVEGYEAAILDAAQDELAKNRPVLVVEVLRHVPRLRAILGELSAANYLVFAIGVDSLRLITTEELAAPGPLPRYGSRDVILLPAERAHQL